MYTILRSKREATRLQILVEIAEHQPAVRQQEIALKLGVTPQAVSEYVRELVEDGMVSAHGRGRYDVTRSGIEWVLNHAEVLEAYARHIRRDVIHQVSTWTAIASEDLSTGDVVGVYMKNGFLYAGKEPRSAMGNVVMDAESGSDVGVARLNGIIDHTEGKCIRLQSTTHSTGGFPKCSEGPFVRGNTECRYCGGHRARSLYRPSINRERTRYVLRSP